jgi:hypothetical protein
LLPALASGAPSVVYLTFNTNVRNFQRFPK